MNRSLITNLFFTREQEESEITDSFRGINTKDLNILFPFFLLLLVHDIHSVLVLSGTST